MKARELRIGNKFMDDYGSIHTVCGLDRAGFVFFRGMHPIHDKKIHQSLIKGVPLTEEWLLRFEFTVVYNDYKSYRKGEFRMIQWDDGTWSQWTNGECAESLGRHIEYVHQLQNRYFEHQGDELLGYRIVFS